MASTFPQLVYMISAPASPSFHKILHFSKEPSALILTLSTNVPISNSGPRYGKPISWERKLTTLNDLLLQTQLSKALDASTSTASLMKKALISPSDSVNLWLSLGP